MNEISFMIALLGDGHVSRFNPVRVQTGVTVRVYATSTCDLIELRLQSPSHLVAEHSSIEPIETASPIPSQGRKCIYHLRLLPGLVSEDKALFSLDQ